MDIIEFNWDASKIGTLLMSGFIFFRPPFLDVGVKYVQVHFAGAFCRFKGFAPW